MHCSGGNTTDPIWRELASSDRISSWTPLKPQHSIPCWISVQWEPRAVKKRDHQMFVVGFALSDLLGSGRASILLPAVMTTSFFLIFSEHPWDKLRANLPHLQFLANNYAYNSHTDIKLCTYCLYRHTTVLIDEILYLANQLWCSDFHTPFTPLVTPHRLFDFLESLILLKDWFSIHARWLKSSLKHSIRFCGIFPSLKQNFIAFRSSKVSSRTDCLFEIHQLWQSGFSRVYSNCCCSC